MTNKIVKKRKYDVKNDVDIFGKPTSVAPDIVKDLGLNDVLLGRGAQINHYEGNSRFRELIRQRKDDYSATTNRRLKDTIAREIVAVVMSKNGRFLKRYEDIDHAKSHRTQPSVPSISSPSMSIIEEAVTTEKAHAFGDDVWIAVNPEIAVEKAKQALRDQECKGNADNCNNTVAIQLEPSEPAKSEPTIQDDRQGDEVVSHGIPHDKQVVTESTVKNGVSIGSEDTNMTETSSQREVLDIHDISNSRPGTSRSLPREGRQLEDKGKPRFSKVAGTSVSRLRQLVKRRTVGPNDQLENDDVDAPSKAQNEYGMATASRNQEYKPASSSLSRLRALQSKQLKTEDTNKDELQRSERSSGKADDHQESRLRPRSEEDAEQKQSNFTLSGKSVTSLREQLVQQLQANAESLKQLQANSGNCNGSQLQFAQPCPSVAALLQQRRDLIPNLDQQGSMLYSTLLQQTHPLLRGDQFLGQGLGGFNTLASSSIGMDVPLCNQTILNAAALARQYGQIADGASGLGFPGTGAALSNEFARQHVERQSQSGASLATLLHQRQQQLQANSDKAAAASMLESLLLRQSNINTNLTGLPFEICHAHNDSTLLRAASAFHGIGSNIGNNVATQQLDLMAGAANASSYRSMNENDIRSNMIRELLQLRGSIDMNLDRSERSRGTVLAERTD